MKKLIYVLIFSLCLIINLDNAFAKETSENSIITNGSKISVSCKVNNSYSIKVGGNDPKYVYIRDNKGSLNESFQTLSLTEPVSLNNINFTSFKYVYINNFKFLIDPLLLNSFKEGDCLDVAINNVPPEELKEDGKNTVVIYATTTSGTTSDGAYNKSSKATCVYGGYTINIDNSKDKNNITVDFDISYTTVNNNLTLSNFTDKNGNLFCPNQIYYFISPVPGGQVVNLNPDSKDTYTGVGYLNRDSSYVYNAPSAEVQKSLVCNYAGGSIIKMDNGELIFSFEDIDGELNTGSIKIGNSCPEKIYKYCHNSYGHKGCTLSLESNGGQVLKLDENTSTPPIGEKNIKELLGGLKNPISLISNKVLDYELSLDGQPTTLNNIGSNNSICTMTQCKTNKYQYTEKALREIFSYCDKVYESSKNLKNDTKVADCVAVTKFYNRLVEEGLISDYAEGCSFITSGLKEKLEWILDLLKIAGPILAIGLGTLDFIKAVASGDADKEMKTAFKRFSTRIIAAILLFLIPFILSFIMDIFLENQEGYNSDDPFCNLVKWEE